MRKWIVLGVLFLAAIILFVVNTLQLNTGGKKLSIYNALPQSTSIFFEFTDINSSLEKLQNQVYTSALINTDCLKKLNQQAEILNNLIEEVSTESENLSGHKCLAGIYITEANQYDYLYLVDFGKTDDDALFDAIRSVKSWKVNERNYRDEKVFELKNEDLVISCAYIGGVFIAGFTPFLVEESVLQIKSNSNFTNNKDFESISNKNLSADFSVYIHYPELGRVLPLIIKKEAKITSLIKQFAIWTRLDVNLKNQGILLSGYTTTGEGTILNKSKYTAAENWSLLNAVPNNVAYLICNTAGENSYPIDTNIDIAGYFNSWLGYQWGWGALESFDSNLDEESFLLSTVIDAEEAFANLSELGRLSDFDFNLDTYSKVAYGKLNIADTLAALFKTPYINIVNPYFAVVDEVVIFANTVKTLRSIISAINLRRTVTADIEYVLFSKNLANGANVNTYIDVSKLDEWVAANLLGVNEDEKQYRHFSPASFQFSYFDNLFFTNGYILFRDEIKTNTNFIWETKLLAKAISKPTYVTNHYNKETEIIVQDSLYNLYLLNKAGKILWKRNVEGPVMGEIFQIDYYKNNKLQFVFNTPDRIFILDRIGNNVANFPIKLPAKAANGMLLVEYKNKKYRYFLTCTNNNIYGYYHNGKPLPGGWSPKRNAGVMDQPFIHIYNDKKDYLIAYNNEGDIFYFDRKGDKRVKPMLTKTHFPQAFKVIEVKKGFALVNADTSGLVYSLNSKGGVTQLESGYTGNNYMGFVYANLTADKGYEYLYHDSTHFEVYNSDKAEVVNYNFEQVIDQPVFEVNFPDKKKRLGFYSDEDDLLYLFNKDLALYSNFPLQGSTQFDVADLYKNKENVLVVGDNEGFIRAYKLR